MAAKKVNEAQDNFKKVITGKDKENKCTVAKAKVPLVEAQLKQEQLIYKQLQLEKESARVEVNKKLVAIDGLKNEPAAKMARLALKVGELCGQKALAEKDGRKKCDEAKSDMKKANDEVQAAEMEASSAKASLTNAHKHFGGEFEKQMIRVATKVKELENAKVEQSLACRVQLKNK